MRSGKLYKLNKKEQKLHGVKFYLITTVKMLVFIVTVLAVFAILRSQLIVVRTYSVLSRSSGKVRIVALTDLHGNIHGKQQERIVRIVRKAEPDIIVYLGDMIERTRASESAKSLISLTQRLIEIAPVFYVDGNHEQDVQHSELEIYNELNKSLTDAGAVQLTNNTQQLTIGDDCILNLCGITTHYYWKKTENEVVTDLRKRDGINVMLCHYPETVIWREAFDGGGLDLALCGHTHGGLIRVPFKGGMYAPEWGWWPMYDLGEYPIYSDTDWRHYGGEEGAEYWGTMIISGGLAGEHGVPRINNPMEILVVEIGN